MTFDRANLIIVKPYQFGYHSDTYYYCKYLRNRYNVTYIGWNAGLEKINLDGIKIVHVNRSGGLLRGLRLFKAIFAEALSRKSILFIDYFKGLAIIVRLLLYHNPIIFDIRTCSVKPGRLERFIDDSLLKFGCFFFRHITLASESLAVRLGLQDRAVLLPIGAEVISETHKHFDQLNLLYVGTLYNRNLDRVIKGFAIFVDKYDKTIPLQLTIIGEGIENEKKSLQQQVEELGLGDVIKLPGRIPHDHLKGYFDIHNVGVSFVPMTDYYDVQPVTKTFEYLLSGLAVIGTATSENKRVINDSNGILTKDTAEDFSRGLVRLLNQLKTFDSEKIRNDAQQFSMKIITDEFDSYLKSFS